MSHNNMHSTSQPNLHASGFTVAGMSTSTSSNNQSSWNPATGPNNFGSLADSLNQSLSQSRSHYQPGYLMSASQSNNVSQNGQRFDDAPTVQTKAKMNHVLTRGSTADFGTDSMFESSRPRKALADEDAPPMTSINDMMNEIPPDSSSSRFQSKHSPFNPAQSRGFLPHKSHSTPAKTFSPSFDQSDSAQGQQPLFVIVFGYPPDKYSATLEYFRSLGGDIGDTTEATPNSQIVNCFKLGFNNPADAARAVRKNGEVLGGCWMVGVKWADAAQAEAVLGPALTRSTAVYDSYSNSPPDIQVDTSMTMAVDEGFHNDAASPTHGGYLHTPSVGTPIKLAPSVSAFRKGGPDSVQRSTPSTASSGSVASRQQLPQHTPSKSVIGQVSDLIFGW